MGMSKNDKLFKVVAAYDTETTNLKVGSNGETVAFPITHQVGLINIAQLDQVTVDNVKDVVSVKVFRHTVDAFREFNLIMDMATDYVPVIAVHNLGFDHTNLAPYFNELIELGYEVQVCAKTSTKPITYKVMHGRECVLCFLDTFSLFLASLDTLGKECGIPKLVGSWDYDLVRNTETPLTDAEYAYAVQDIYTLVAYLGHWLRMTPEVKEEDLGLSVMTKTGVVRRKRMVKFAPLGKGKSNVGKMWNQHNRSELPKTEDELFTTHAATRGGFTFTAAKHASVVFTGDDTHHVFAFDAASQHPAQMVSHRYPEKFHQVSASVLQAAFDSVASTNIDQIMSKWHTPFTTAFNGFFVFKNLRLKEGSLYERHGISPLASARLSNSATNPSIDNETGENFKAMIKEKGYKDYAVNVQVAFGKIMAAEECGLFLTELAAWEVVQAFDYDEVTAVYGYATSRFTRPTDMSLLSVMYFYKAKNIFKIAKNAHDSRKPIPNPEELKMVAPEYLANAMLVGTAKDGDVSAYYQSLKADLNSLFGIEATNEAKPDTLLTADGITFAPCSGLDDLPINPKCQYQYGQRIVGWSRIAQHVVMQAVANHCEAIICGDTDSVKVYATDEDLIAIKHNLAVFEGCLSESKQHVTLRIRSNFPEYFDELPGIGGYEHEDTFDHFYCAWNKAYVYMHYDKKYGKNVFNFTLAGVTTDRDFVDCDGKVFENSYNNLANYLYHVKGYTFAEVSQTLLGYNLIIDPSITKLNARFLPKWGSIYKGEVTDYTGATSHVAEPYAVALAPMPKMVGATENAMNAINCEYAKRNNPNVNTDILMLTWKPGAEPDIINLSM